MASFIGIDQGYSKTSAAFVNEVSGNKSFLEEYTQFKPGVILDRQEMYLSRLSKIFNSSVNLQPNSRVFLAANQICSVQKIKEIIFNQEISSSQLVFMNDTDAAFGASPMTQNALTCTFGSFYNVIYYNESRKPIKFDRLFTGATNCFAQLCAYSLGNLVLDVYVRDKLSKDVSQMVDMFAQILPKCPSIYDSLVYIRTKSNRGVSMQFAPLIEEILYHEIVQDYLERSFKNFKTGILLLQEKIFPEKIESIVLSGGVLKNVYIKSQLSKVISEDLGLKVEIPSNTTSEGAIRYGMNYKQYTNLR